MNAEQAADSLLACAADRSTRPPLTEEWPDLDLEGGYRIQEAWLERRLARGERVVGLKLGLTSRAKQEQVGVDSPITAPLTDAMVLPYGAPLPVAGFIHPRVEPEIVFRMASRLAGSRVTAEEAMAAVASVHAGAEVIDSRFDDFRFQPPDVVADGASAAGFIVAPDAVAPGETDLSLEPCLVEVDGVVVDSATGAAIQGHPAAALAAAANALGARGLAIEAGWTVLTGGLTNAVPLAGRRSVAFRFGGLGSITIGVEERHLGRSECPS